MVQGGLKKVQGGLEPPLAPHFPRLCPLHNLAVLILSAFFFFFFAYRSTHTIGLL